MNEFFGGTTFLAAAVFCFCATVAGGQGVEILPGRDIEVLGLSDGSELRATARVYYPERRESAAVTVYLHRDRRVAEWVKHFTAVDFVPGRSYYLLVTITEKGIFLFSTWNGQHCMIHLGTGKTVEEGRGDDILREYGSFAPLKVRPIIGPSVGYDSASGSPQGKEKSQADANKAHEQVTEPVKSDSESRAKSLRNRFEHGAPAGSGEASGSSGPGGSGEKVR